VVTAVTNLTLVGLGAVGAVLAARLLGPEGRGQLATAMVWALLITAVGTMGVPQALTYRAARDPASVGRIFGTALALLASQTLGVLLVGHWVIGRVLGGSSAQTLWTTRLYLLSVPSSLLIAYLSTLAQGLQRFSLCNGLRVLGAAGYPLGLVLAVPLGARLDSVIPILVASQSAAGAAALAVFLVRVRPEMSASVAEARGLLAWGLQTFWGSLCWNANARLDQCLLSALVPMRDLGQYAVAVSYAGLLFSMSGGFALLLFPAVAAEASRGRERIGRTLMANLVVTGIAAVLMAGACPVILPLLFGQAFREAVPVAHVLLAASVVLGANYVLSDGLRGLGRPNLVSAAETAGLLVTAIMLWLLLPRWGTLGAAWASLLSYGMVMLVLLSGLHGRPRR
jgi:O-antigen/teichoic acid export membrane protein